MGLGLTATGAAVMGGNALAALAQLENSLRPVERYAVRFLEQVCAHASGLLSVCEVDMFIECE